jgi:hypothetical protein
MERIDSNLFPLFKGLFDAFLLDALNAQIGEGARHTFVVNFQRTHAFFASFLAHQTVRMRSVWHIFGDAGNNNDCSTAISYNLNK